MKIDNIDLSVIEKEYSFEHDNPFKDKGRMMLAAEQLSPKERSFLIAYAEMESYSQMAKLLGCSASWIQKKMNKIRKKIFKIIPAINEDSI